MSDSSFFSRPLNYFLNLFNKKKKKPQCTAYYLLFPQGRRNKRLISSHGEKQHFAHVSRCDEKHKLLLATAINATNNIIPNSQARFRSEKEEKYHKLKWACKGMLASSVSTTLNKKCKQMSGKRIMTLGEKEETVGLNF